MYFNCDFYCNLTVKFTVYLIILIFNIELTHFSLETSIHCKKPKIGPKTVLINGVLLMIFFILSSKMWFYTTLWIMYCTQPVSGTKLRYTVTISIFGFYATTSHFQIFLMLIKYVVLLQGWFWSDCVSLFLFLL